MVLHAGQWKPVEITRFVILFPLMLFHDVLFRSRSAAK